MSRTFTTQEEMWRHLIDGGKIKGVAWENGYLHLAAGNLVNHRGDPCFPSHELLDPTVWRPHAEPVAWKAEEIDEVVDYMRDSITMGLKSREREKVYEQVIGYLTEYKRLLIHSADHPDGNIDKQKGVK